MRIRQSKITPTPSPHFATGTSASTSPVCSTSASSCSSSSIHSTISSHSLTSSSNSTSFSSSPPRPPRCEGLDLLVKAIYHVVDGSVVGVPYIQRRVIRRRKPAVRFSNLVIMQEFESEPQVVDECDDYDGNVVGKKVGKAKKKVKAAKRGKGGNLSSVLESLKPKNRKKKKIK